jgi:MFS family permease
MFCFLWGVTIIGCGLAQPVWLFVVFLMVGGAVDSLIVTLLSATIQRVTPDEYQGRVSAAEYLVSAGGPKVGDFRAGVLGWGFGPTVSVVSGGLAVLVVAGVLRFSLPAFIRFRITEHPPASGVDHPNSKESDKKTSRSNILQEIKLLRILR